MTWIEKQKYVHKNQLGSIWQVLYPFVLNPLICIFLSFKHILDSFTFYTTPLLTFLRQLKIILLGFLLSYIYQCFCLHFDLLNTFMLICCIFWYIPIHLLIWLLEQTNVHVCITNNIYLYVHANVVAWYRCCNIFIKSYTIINLANNLQSFTSYVYDPYILGSLISTHFLHLNPILWWCLTCLICKERKFSYKLSSNQKKFNQFNFDLLIDRKWLNTY